MLCERRTFQARFGQGDAIVAQFNPFNAEIAPQHGLELARIMVDTTGAMFTIAVEQT